MAPLNKGYLRSFVPTVSSLLSGVTEDQQPPGHLTVPIYSMEVQTEREGIKAASSNIDKILYDSNSSGRTRDRFRFRGISNRTEDTFMRENEDSALTHYCPIDNNRGHDPQRSSEKDESEDSSDRPTEMDSHASWNQTDSSLRSEEIPFLLAEKPSESDSEENESSDVDASTFMIYAPLENQQSSVDEDCSRQLLEKGKMTPRFRRLDEKTMAAWEEESSDDTEYSLCNENELEMLKKYVVGDESDMEEFYETSEVERDNGELDSLGSDDNRKSILKKDKSLKSETEKEMNVESSSEQSGNEEHSEDKDIDNNEQRNSDTQQPGDSEMESKEESKNNSYESYNPPSSDDQTQCDSLEAEVENAMLNATVKLNALADIPKTTCNISSDVTEKVVDDEISKRFTSPEDSDKTNDGVLEGENQILDGTKCEDKTNVASAETASKPGKEDKDDTMGFHSKLEANASQKQPKERKQGILSMEPVAMNLENSSETKETQFDLATALRFMTEVYRTKEEDELYSDTLSNMDIILDEIPKTSVISDDYQGIRNETTAENFIDLKSQRKSNTFEPVVLTEEERTVIRPRNIFTQFFKSFKKKLTKKE